jgi:hypothetical protein
LFANVNPSIKDRLQENAALLDVNRLDGGVDTRRSIQALLDDRKISLSSAKAPRRQTHPILLILPLSDPSPNNSLDLDDRVRSFEQRIHGTEEIFQLS